MEAPAERRMVFWLSEVAAAELVVMAALAVVGPELEIMQPRQ